MLRTAALAGAAVVLLATAGVLRAQVAERQQPTVILQVIPTLGDSAPNSLNGKAGDPARGRSLAIDREGGNCILCHVLPSPEERLYGNLGPSLNGVGNRLSEGQIRFRLIDSRRLNPDTIMPSYLGIEGLVRVAAPYQGKSVLTVGDIEDLVAYLVTLTDIEPKR